MNKNCLGCGVKLQDYDNNKVGYVLDINNSEYCKRCFRLKNYNEIPKILAKKEDFFNVFSKVINKKGLVILVVDIFDFEGSFTKEIVDLLRTKRVIVAVNKIDILPKSTNLTNIVEYVFKRCNKIFFKVEAVHLISSLKGYFIDQLLISIDNLRNDGDVYFLGLANVGKSSLINKILKQTKNYNSNEITTSALPGTTLDQIKIPYFIDNKCLIDTPGLINEKSFLNVISNNTYKLVVPKKEIKPLTFQIHNDNSIIIGGFGYFSFTASEKISVVCYFSSDVVIHRCKTLKVSSFFNENKGITLFPPLEEELRDIKYKDYSFKIDDTKMDIAISGLGFISIKGKCKVDLYSISNIDISLRKSMIGL